MDVSEAAFGSMPDGTKVVAYTLSNGSGMEVRAITYGAVIVSIKVPDRNGRVDDVVVGHDNLEGYLTKSRFFGAVVGRYGNRIANGRFVLDGKTYQLAQNNGPNHLHGGAKGFDKVVWNGEIVKDARGASVRFARTSPDGEENYPGNLATRITYTLTDKNELIVEYHAASDKPTPVNLTQHSYFNLAGDGSGDVLQHRLMLNADRYTPVDATQIPTGDISPVDGTPFDFRKETSIGARIDGDHPQLRIGSGYDHNFVLTRNGNGLEQAARVVDPKTGRTLTVATTEPGVQFYSGTSWTDRLRGKAATSTALAPGSASRPSTFQIRRTSPRFRRPFSGPARSIGRRRCSRSALRSDWGSLLAVVAQ